MSKQWMNLGTVGLLALAVAAGSEASAAASPDSGGSTIEVPGDVATIQEAVDSAAPGDLILVSPGTYNEAVNVQTDGITIRGLDRNDVILDGELELDNGIRVLGASGVAVENLTGINYTANAFFWTGVDGYRGSYLTAYRNGAYGLYAFDSINGQFDHSYAAGAGVGGFYVGQCFPCNAVVDSVVAEHNSIGFFGTNAGGNLFVVRSRFNNNRVGLLPNSGSYELCFPQRELVIAGNLVYSNNQADAPGIELSLMAMGNGMYVAGGIGDTVANNRVWDHDHAGIAFVPYVEEAPADDQPGPDEWDRSCEESAQDPVNMEPPDSLLWDPINNVITGNVVEDSRVADLVLASIGTDLSTLGNCFAGNEFTTSAPAELEALAPCDSDGVGDWNAGQLDLDQWNAEAQAALEPPPYETAELPDLEPQENMPDAPNAPADPAIDIVIDIEVSSVGVPGPPAG